MTTPIVLNQYYNSPPGAALDHVLLTPHVTMVSMDVTQTRTANMRQTSQDDTYIHLLKTLFFLQTSYCVGGSINEGMCHDRLMDKTSDFEINRNQLFSSSKINDVGYGDINDCAHYCHDLQDQFNSFSYFSSTSKCLCLEIRQGPTVSTGLMVASAVDTYVSNSGPDSV